METGEAVGRLVVAVQTDLTRLATDLEDIVGRMRWLEADGKMVPGLSPLLKGKGNEQALTVEALREACSSVPKALTGSDSEPKPTREP